jgi:hypothetical protein
MFFEEFQNLYGTQLKNFIPIFISKNMDNFYLVQTDKNIEFVRVWPFGDETKIKIYKQIPITEDYFKMISDAVIYSMGIQKWME